MLSIFKGLFIQIDLVPDYIFRTKDKFHKEENVLLNFLESTKTSVAIFRI